jgi:hypothetical protein
MGRGPKGTGTLIFDATSAFIPGETLQPGAGGAARRDRLGERDRDATYARPWDGVFCSEGIRSIRTPILAPRLEPGTPEPRPDRARWPQ